MNSFTDERDGEIYRTIQIGNQVWMAENLRYKCDGAVCPFGDGDSDLVKTHGLLYFAHDLNHIAPDGWRVPSSKDWVELFWNVDGHRTDNIDNDCVYTNAGKVLKSKNGWDIDDDFLCGYEPGEKADPFGFCALPTGQIADFTFMDFQKTASFWAANENRMQKRVALYNFSNCAYIQKLSPSKIYACSIRCVRSNK